MFSRSDSLFDFEVRNDGDQTRFAVRRKFKLHNWTIRFLHFDAASASFVLCVSTKRNVHRVAVTNDSFSDARSLPKPALDANMKWWPYACVLHGGVCIVNNCVTISRLYVFGGEAFTSVRCVQFDVFVRLDVRRACTFAFECGRRSARNRVLRPTRFSVGCVSEVHRCVVLINEHILLSNMLLVRQLFGTSLYPLCVFASCALSKRTAYHRYVKFATRFVWYCSRFVVFLSLALLSLQCRWCSFID